jgi:hypothetical protein
MSEFVADPTALREALAEHEPVVQGSTSSDGGGYYGHVSRCRCGFPNNRFKIIGVRGWLDHLAEVLASGAMQTRATIERVRRLPANWRSIRDGVLSPGLSRAADSLRIALAPENALLDDYDPVPGLVAHGVIADPEDGQDPRNSGTGGAT